MLGVVAGESSISLPLHGGAAAPAAPALCPPEEPPAYPMTELAPGVGARTITRELGSGRAELRLDWDLGGTNRDEVSGTEITFASDAIFEITEDDPLSARVVCNNVTAVSRRAEGWDGALGDPHRDDLRRGELPHRVAAAGPRRRPGVVRPHLVVLRSAHRRLNRYERTGSGSTSSCGGVAPATASSVARLGGALGERVAQRHLLEEPGEHEGDDCDRNSPQEHAVQRVGEGAEELLVDERRQLVGLGGAELDAAADVRDDIVWQARRADPPGARRRSRRRWRRRRRRRPSGRRWRSRSRRRCSRPARRSGPRARAPASRVRCRRRSRACRRPRARERCRRRAGRAGTCPRRWCPCRRSGRPGSGRCG